MAGIATTNSIHAAFTARAAVGGYVVVADANRSVRTLPGSSPMSGTQGFITTK